MSDILNIKKEDSNWPQFPIPNAKEQVKFYNENPHIETPTQTLKNLSKKKSLNKQNADVLLSLILQRLVWADPDIDVSSSDVRLQVGEYPTYYVKSQGWWVRDKRMPIIDEYIMRFFFDYVIPEENKSNIVENKSKWINSVDEDFSIDLNMNKNFNYSHKSEVEHDYLNQYATKPQFIVDFWGTPDINLSRFRWNLTKARGSYVIILRKIDAEIPDFFEYKLNPKFLDFIQYERGLVLITWPTGSWKSLTMAAIINEINKTQKKHIVTLENPIEFVHPNKMSFFTQRDIPWDSATFSAWMKSALRQKPDIIIFGEMRDRETIAGALEAAETWHLVFWTLHTFNAAKTIDRLINAFPEEAHSQVAASLSWAFVWSISQMLVKTKKGGITALNEMVKWTEWVKQAIWEMNSDKITASAWNDPTTHLTMVNHAFELIKNDIVEPNELFKKIYVEDVDTYKALVLKLKAEQIYDSSTDLYTEYNQKKIKQEREDEIKKKMWIEKKEVVKTNIWEAGKIENELNNEEINKKVNKKSRLLI